MKKVILILIFSALFISCNKKVEPVQKEVKTIVKKETKKETEFLQIEYIITSVTKENKELLIRELEAVHKHNDFVHIETDKEPIDILFEEINGKMIYTGVQYEYNKHNEKKENVFTTLTALQLKGLKEKGETGWKD